MNPNCFGKGYNGTIEAVDVNNIDIPFIAQLKLKINRNANRNRKVKLVGTITNPNTWETKRVRYFLKRAGTNTFRLFSFKGSNLKPLRFESYIFNDININGTCNFTGVAWTNAGFINSAQTIFQVTKTP